MLLCTGIRDDDIDDDKNAGDDWRMPNNTVREKIVSATEAWPWQEYENENSAHEVSVTITAANNV